MHCLVTDDEVDRLNCMSTVMKCPCKLRDCFAVFCKLFFTNNRHTHCMASFKCWVVVDQLPY